MEVEQAIKLAIDAVTKLFTGRDYRLEEVEVRDGGDFEITVSFHDPSSSGAYTFGATAVTSMVGSRRAAIGVDASRTYKDVMVGAEGKIKSIRMRQIVVG